MEGFSGTRGAFAVAKLMGIEISREEFSIFYALARGWKRITVKPEWLQPSSILVIREKTWEEFRDTMILRGTVAGRKALLDFFSVQRIASFISDIIREEEVEKALVSAYEKGVKDTRDDMALIEGRTDTLHWPPIPRTGRGTETEDEEALVSVQDAGEIELHDEVREFMQAEIQGDEQK